MNFKSVIEKVHLDDLNVYLDVDLERPEEGWYLQGKVSSPFPYIFANFNAGDQRKTYVSNVSKYSKVSPKKCR